MITVSVITPEEIKELNDELVVPAYRRFCRENGLKFHFQDGELRGRRDRRIFEEEFKLQHEAMTLFNRLKPEYHLQGNQVVSFQLIAWGLDIKLRRTTVEDFFQKHAELLSQSKRDENLIVALLVGFIIATCFLGISVCRLFPGFTLWVCFISGLLFIGGVYYWTETRPVRSRKREFDRLQAQLEDLRQRLNGVQKGTVGAESEKQNF